MEILDKDLMEICESLSNFNNKLNEEFNDLQRKQKINHSAEYDFEKLILEENQKFSEKILLQRKIINDSNYVNEILKAQKVAALEREKEMKKINFRVDEIKDKEESMIKPLKNLSKINFNLIIISLEKENETESESEKDRERDKDKDKDKEMLEIRIKEKAESIKNIDGPNDNSTICKKPETPLQRTSRRNSLSRKSVMKEEKL